MADVSPAGSVTGIDLSTLTADIKRMVKLADDVGRSRQSNSYAMNSCAVESLVNLEAKVLKQVVALARATLQHPEATPVGEVVAIRENDGQATVGLYGEAPPTGALLYTRSVAPGPAVIATPQHSVTEQASVPDGWLLAQREPSQEQLNYAAYNMNRKRSGPDMVTAEFLRECWSNLLHSRPTLKSSAQPLASTAAPQIEYRYTGGVHWCDLGPAEYMKENFDGVYRLKAGKFPTWQGDTAATQPEQASIKTWQERYNEMGKGPSFNDKSVAMMAEIDDLRAALAIPASTAASEQQADDAHLDPDPIDDLVNTIDLGTPPEHGADLVDSEGGHHD